MLRLLLGVFQVLALAQASFDDDLGSFSDSSAGSFGDGGSLGSLSGSVADGSLSGSFGSDSLSGSVGDDSVGGSVGDDSISGSVGDESVSGSIGDDSISGSTGSSFSGSLGSGSLGSGSLGSGSFGSGSDSLGDDSVGSGSVGSGSVGSGSVGSGSVGSGSFGDDSVGSASVGSASVGSGSFGDDVGDHSYSYSGSFGGPSFDFIDVSSATGDANSATYGDEFTVEFEVFESGLTDLELRLLDAEGVSTTLFSDSSESSPFVFAMPALEPEMYYTFSLFSEQANGGAGFEALYGGDMVEYYADVWIQSTSSNNPASVAYIGTTFEVTYGNGVGVSDIIISVVDDEGTVMEELESAGSAEEDSFTFVVDSAYEFGAYYHFQLDSEELGLQIVTAEWFLIRNTGSDSGSSSTDCDSSASAADGCIDLTIRVYTGTWPSEISWSVDSACPTVSGGSYATKNVEETATACLAPGAWSFVAADSYGDGWNSGWFSIERDDTGDLLLTEQTVAGFGASFEFTIEDESCVATTCDECTRLGGSCGWCAESLSCVETTGTCSGSISTSTLSCAADSLTITSPTSSDSWATATDQTITWTSTGLRATTSLDVYLVDQNADDDEDGMELLEDGVSNSGSLTITVPSDEEAGDYAVYIETSKSSLDVSATSEVFAVTTSCNDIVIKIYVGDWGSEMSWEIGDVDGAEGGPYTISGAWADEVTVCVAPGDYVLQVRDSYGDGWNSDGSYTIYEPSTNTNLVGPKKLTTGYGTDVDFTVGNYEGSAGEVSCSDYTTCSGCTAAVCGWCDADQACRDTQGTCSDEEYTSATGTCPTASLTVVAPASEDVFLVDTTYEIQWTSTGIDTETEVAITLYRMSDLAVALTIAEETANDGSYDWQVPDSLSPEEYYITVAVAVDSTLADEAVSATFSVEYDDTSDCAVYTTACVQNQYCLLAMQYADTSYLALDDESVACGLYCSYLTSCDIDVSGYCYEGQDCVETDSGSTSSGSTSSGSAATSASSSGGGGVDFAYECVDDLYIDDASCVNVELHLQMGLYANENSWYLNGACYDADTPLMGSGYSEDDFVVVTACLPASTAGLSYTFVASDSYGDGWNSGTGGESYFVIMNADAGTSLVESTAVEGTGSSTTLTLVSTATECASSSCDACQAEDGCCWLDSKGKCTGTDTTDGQSGSCLAAADGCATTEIVFSAPLSNVSAASCEDVELTWTSSGISQESFIDLTLWDTGSDQATATTEVTSNSHSYSWSVPSGTPSGSYRFLAEPRAVDGLQAWTEEFTVEQDCSDVLVSINTGSYPDEVSWFIYDWDDELVLSADAYTEADADKNATACLVPGEYTMYAYDSFGDGWNDGTFEVTRLDTGGYLLGPTLSVLGSYEVEPFTVESPSTSLCADCEDFMSNAQCAENSACIWCFEGATCRSSGVGCSGGIVAVTVDASLGSVTPSTGEALTYGGDSYEVTWVSTALSELSLVSIALYTFDPAGDEVLLETVTSSTANTGSYTWEVPLVVNADSYFLRVSSLADYTTADSGFFTIQGAIGACSSSNPVVLDTGSTQFIADGSQPGTPYGVDTACEWEISAPDGYAVQISFFWVDLELNCFDKISIYDSANTLVRIICAGTSTTSLNPSTVLSDDSYLRFVFESDESNTAYGFLAELQAVEITTTTTSFEDSPCSGLVSFEAGQVDTRIADGYGADAYNYSMACAWEFTTKSDWVVSLAFTEFEIEPEASCLYDHLVVYYDVCDSTTGDVVRTNKTLCGTRLPNDIVSSSNYMRVEFYSDSSIQLDGFVAYVTEGDPGSTECLAVEECSGETASALNLITDGSSDAYSASKDCSFLLEVDADSVVKLNFLKFHLEAGLDPDYCPYDYVTVHDGDSEAAPLLTRTCGQLFRGNAIYRSCQSADSADDCTDSVSNIVYSTGSSLYVHFYTDSTNQFGGFTASYKAVAAADAGVTNDWSVSEWGRCEADYFGSNAGSQTRTVSCLPPGSGTEADCLAQNAQKPARERDCDVDDSDIRWSGNYDLLSGVCDPADYCCIMGNFEIVQKSVEDVWEILVTSLAALGTESKCNPANATSVVVYNTDFDDRRRLAADDDDGDDDVEVDQTVYRYVTKLSFYMDPTDTSAEFSAFGVTYTATKSGAFIEFIGSDGGISVSECTSGDCVPNALSCEEVAGYMAIEVGLLLLFLWVWVIYRRHRRANKLLIESKSMDLEMSALGQHIELCPKCYQVLPPSGHCLQCGLAKSTWDLTADEEEAAGCSICGELEHDRSSCEAEWIAPSHSAAMAAHLRTLPMRPDDELVKKEPRLLNWLFPPGASLYPIWSTNMDNIGYGVGVALYFRTLKYLMVLIVCCALVAVPIIASNTLAQPSQLDWKLKGSYVSSESFSFCQGLTDLVICAVLMSFSAIAGRREARAVAELDLLAQTPQDYSVVVNRPPGAHNTPDHENPTKEEWQEFFEAITADMPVLADEHYHRWRDLADHQVGQAEVNGVSRDCEECGLPMRPVFCGSCQQNMLLCPDSHQHFIPDEVRNPSPPKISGVVVAVSTPLKDRVLYNAINAKKQAEEHLYYGRQALKKHGKEIPDTVAPPPLGLRRLLQKFGLARDIHFWARQLRAADEKLEALQREPVTQVSRVYVTFDTELAQATALRRTAGTWWETKTEKWRGLRKPRFERFRGHVVRVTAAPEPSDVIWEHNEIHVNVRRLRGLIAYMLCGVVLLLAALFLSYVQDNGSGQYANYIIAVTIASVNFGLQFLCKWASRKFETHLTTSTQQDSLMLKLTVARIVNTAALLYFTTPDSDYLSSQFVSKVQATLLADLAAAGVRAIDPLWIFKRHIKARFFTPATQEQLDLLYTARIVDIAERYSDILKTLFVALFYIAILPTGLFATIVAFAGTYWVDKYCVLRLWKKSPEINNRLSARARLCFDLSIVAHLLVTRSFYQNWPFETLETDIEPEGDQAALVTVYTVFFVIGLANLMNMRFGLNVSKWIIAFFIKVFEVDLSEKEVPMVHDRFQDLPGMPIVPYKAHCRGASAEQFLKYAGSSYEDTYVGFVEKTEVSRHRRGRSRASTVGSQV